MRFTPITIAFLLSSGCPGADKQAAPAKEPPAPGHAKRSERELLDRAGAELVKALGAEGKQAPPVMSVETVERGGTTLFQFRVSGPDVGRNQVPGLDRPVFIPYIFDHVESTAERATGPIAVVETVSGLMRRGEVPVSPIVVFLVTRPGKRIRTWVEGLDRDLGTAERELLTKRTGEIAADDVERLDAVGIVFPRSGQPINAFDLPMPSEWSAAMMLAGRPLPVPDLLQIVWPDTRAP